MQRLDDLLTRIANEPISNVTSDNEAEFFEKCKELRGYDFVEYVRYLIIYDEVMASKLDDDYFSEE